MRILTAMVGGKKIFSLDVSGQSHPIFNVSVWKSHFNIKK